MWGPYCLRDDLIAGNIYKKSLSKIWDSKRFHKLRLYYKYNFNTKHRAWKDRMYCNRVMLFNKTTDFLKNLGIRDEEY